MASSFIDIGENGFWANDGFVEAMQLCLINEIEQSGFERIEKWLKGYKIELAFQSLPLIYGGMSMSVEEFITDKERKNIIIKLIDSIISRINKDKNYLTGDNMHLFRKRAMETLWQEEKVEFKDEKEFRKHVNSSRWKESSIHKVRDRYLHSFILFRKLINGEISTTAGSPINYWNY